MQISPRPGLAIVCREAFLDGLPVFLDGWELIEVSLEDVEKKLATNVLVLDAKTDLVAADIISQYFLPKSFTTCG